MLPTQKIMRELQNNGREMAHKGSEILDKAIRSYRDTFEQAKKEGPEYVSNLFKKGEQELTDVRQSLETLIRDHLDRMITLKQDFREIYTDLRTRIVKEFPFDQSQYHQILNEIELHLSLLPIPFFRKMLFPIADYDNLSVNKIKEQLSSLSHDQLQLLLQYESKHSNRVTLKRELDKLINQN